MAVGETPLSTEVQTAQTLNKPLFLGENLVETSTDITWQRADASAAFPTFVLAPSTPIGDIDRLKDRFKHLNTRTTTAEVLNDTEKWWLVQVIFPEDVSFDTVVVAGHNLQFPGGGPSALVGDVSLYIGDDSDDFTAAVATGPIATETIGVAFEFPKDLAFTTLDIGLGGVPSTMTGVRKLWFAIKGISVAPAETAAFQPIISEIFVGNRRHLLHNADKPFSDIGEMTDLDQFDARSGVKQKYINFRGKAVRNFKMETGTDNEISAIRGWWDDTNEGSLPFYYIEDPGKTDPQERLPYLMEIGQTPFFDFPIDGPIRRVFNVNMDELPPFLSSLEQRKP